MIFKKIVLIFFLSLIFQKNNAQNNEKYSLLNFYISKAKKNIAESNKDSVLFYYNKMALLKDKKNNYKKYIYFLSDLGHYFEGEGAIEKSIKIYQEGLNIAEKKKDYILISQMFIEISGAYRIFQDRKTSLKYGKKALSILDKDSTNSIKAKTNALMFIASAYSEKNQPDSALYFEKKILRFLPEIDSSELRGTFINIGYTFMQLNDLKNAKLYTERGLKFFNKNEYYEQGTIFTNLAMYGNRANKLDYALRMFDSAIYYSKKSKYLETFLWIYEERAEVYRKKQNFKSAFEDTKLLVKFKDSIFKSQRDITTQETEAKYNTIKKEAENAQQKEQILEQQLAIKNRNLYAILLAAALLILGIIFFAAYKRNKLKKKQLQKEIDLKDALATIKTQNRLQEQRLRISRDLHDNIGSQLTFIISSVDNLKFITKDANEKLKDKLSNISSFTSETIHQLRDTIWAMNKSEVTVEDLHARILSFIEKAKNATENTEFSIDYNIDKNESFTSLEGMNIFRVVQEAINNAIKYANAAKIEVYIDKKDTNFILFVKDNGIGFDIHNEALGNGLSNMEKRMSEIGGKVNIVSKENEGTKILLSLSSKNMANDV